MSFGGLPCLGSVVLEFLFLNPDTSFGEEIDAIGMVPVHVTDDYIGDIVRSDAEWFQSVGRFYEILHVPVFEKAVVIEAGIEQDVAAIAADQPDRHGDIEFSAGIGASDKFGHGKSRNGGVTHGVDFVARFGLRCGGWDTESSNG